MRLLSRQAVGAPYCVADCNPDAAFFIWGETLEETLTGRYWVGRWLGDTGREAERGERQGGTLAGRYWKRRWLGDTGREGGRDRKRERAIEADFNTLSERKGRKRDRQEERDAGSE